MEKYKNVYKTFLFLDVLGVILTILFLKLRLCTEISKTFLFEFIFILFMNGGCFKKIISADSVTAENVVMISVTISIFVVYFLLTAFMLGAQFLI